jgi:hypothetical protein
LAPDADFRFVVQVVRQLRRAVEATPPPAAGERIAITDLNA